LAVGGEGFEDLIGGLGPYERAGVLVPFGDPLADVGLELGDAAVRGTAQLAVSQLGEPPLDQVDPAGTRRGEVQVEPRMRRIRLVVPAPDARMARRVCSRPRKLLTCTDRRP